jgi:hypothetical protein
MAKEEILKLGKVEIPKNLTRKEERALLAELTKTNPVMQAKIDSVNEALFAIAYIDLHATTKVKPYHILL